MSNGPSQWGWLSARLLVLFDESEAVSWPVHSLFDGDEEYNARVRRTLLAMDREGWIDLTTNRNGEGKVLGIGSIRCVSAQAIREMRSLAQAWQSLDSSETDTRSQAPLMVDVGRYERRDIPVLRFISEWLEQNDPPLQMWTICEEMGLDRPEAIRAVRALIDTGTLVGRLIAVDQTYDCEIRGLTLAGRERAGSWPSPEATVDAVLEALRDSDAPEVRESGNTLSKFARDVMVSVVATAMTGGAA
ncbi:hypothetical protein [Nocardioides pakistanensis]